MSKTTHDNFAGRQEKIYNIHTTVICVSDELANADGCDTPEDFDENVAASIAGLQEALEALVGVIR